MSAKKAMARRNNYVVVVFDSCRYDSFLAGRPKVIRKLGKVERRWFLNLVSDGRISL